jgi:hypothetical protein
MANEIMVTVRFKAQKPGAYALDRAPGEIAANWTGVETSEGVANIGTTEEAIPNANVNDNEGWAFFRNLETTVGASNYIELGVKPSTTFYPMCRLLPGEVAVMRLSPAQEYYAKSNGAARDLEYRILEV